MRYTINVVLPADRTKLGTYTIVDVDGNVQFGPVPCLGLADQATATAHNNPSRDPLFPFGDTPLGLYGVTVIPASSNTHSYGPNQRLLLTPISGPCVVAEDPQHMRDGLLNHGGDPNPAYTFWDSLRPTFGCVRLSNDNMAAAVQAITGAESVQENITEAA
jgi:hypothetical protein